MEGYLSSAGGVLNEVEIEQMAFSSRLALELGMRFLTDHLNGDRYFRVHREGHNPATQIRDLQEFGQHGYRLSKVQPFDLFPQTRHLECVVTLEKA